MKEEIKKQLKKDIRKNRVRKVFEDLLFIYNNNIELDNGVTLLESRYNKLEKDQINGIISKEDYTLEHNRIKTNLLKLLDANNFSSENNKLPIDEHLYVIKYFLMKRRNLPQKKNYFGWGVFFIFLGIMLFLTGTIFFDFLLYPFESKVYNIEKIYSFSIYILVFAGLIFVLVEVFIKLKSIFH